MAAVDAQGTVITFNDGTAAQTVGGVQSFSLSSSKPEREITTLASTAVERKLGLPDNGTLTLDVLYDRNDAGQAAILAAEAANATRQVVITFSDNTTATFNATPKTPPVNAGADDDLKSTIELTITGPITWA